MGVRIGRCDVSVSVPDAEYAAVTQLEVLDTGPEAVKADGVVVLEYTIEPGASTAVTLPEIEIRIEFLLHAVARLMAPRDFNACARVGMSYDESWGTQAVGYEPFAVFAGAAGECRCLVGLACLEHSAQMRAHVYGGPPETVSSGVKGIGAVVVRRNVANLGHFKGREPRTFRDAIYIDTSGVDIYTAVRNYFAWLRGRAYPDDPIVPPGADEVLWHSWRRLPRASCSGPGAGRCSPCACVAIPGTDNSSAGDSLGLPIRRRRGIVKAVVLGGELAVLRSPFLSAG